MTKVIGKRNGGDFTLTLGEKLPFDCEVAFRMAIDDGKKVGLQWWRAVPSFTEPEGFVAGCVWWLDEVEQVVGFEIPMPDPKAIH